MPQIKCNLHTHTDFCDGRNTMEQMVETAVEKGFTTLGFSSHSYTPFDERYCIKNFAAETAEFLRLKKKYAGKICLLNGIEMDAYGEKPENAELDFVIGSVHYLKTNRGHIHKQSVENGFYAIDESKKDFEQMVEEGFGGDILVAAECYYDTLVRMVQKVNPDIIGHFDLISLYGNFSEVKSEYSKIALSALKSIKNSGALIEINSGRLFKGKGGLYPSDFLIEYMAQNGFEFILSSDAHCMEALGYKFDEIIGKVKSLGVKQLVVYDATGRKTAEIT